MRYEVRKIGAAYAEDILRLWNIDVSAADGCVSADTPAASVALAVADSRLDDANAWGAFMDGRLVAAAKWGRIPLSSTPLEYGNVHPGDSVISWLALTDESAAAELLDQDGLRLAQRVYAFPEFGDMARFTPFGTGMLPLNRRRIATFLERRGFAVPSGRDWGAQERILFHLAIPPQGRTAVAPPGLRFVQEGDGLSVTLRLTAADGAAVGVATMCPARLLGRDVPGAAFLGWLGVETPNRGAGLGAALLLAQIDRARQAGAADMYLTTHAERPAWKLYLRMGFAEVGRARSYVREMAAPSSRESR